jgi:membrane associated rhomboid family serine protease
MFPLRDDNPSLTVPVVTRGLIALNVAIFLYEIVLGPDLGRLIQSFALVPLRLTLAVGHGPGPTIRPALTLVSSMFLHGGWLHLLGNMWYLWIFGDNVEDRLGHARFLLFYLAAGVIAGILHTAINADSRVPTLGASGAIAGVLGAYAAVYPRARVMTLLPLFPFFQVIALPALLVLGMWFLFQFASIALSMGNAGGGVAFWAHVGGFAFGFVTLRIVVRRGRRVSEAWAEA